MASDNYYYDGFDYQSSQDYLDIEHQIDLFEIRQYSKAKRQNKQKMKIPSYPITRKSRTRKSQHPLVRIYGINDKNVRQLEDRIFPYTRHLEKRDIVEGKRFECDKKLGLISDGARSDLSLHKKRPSDFNTFRRHFYHTNHQQIKSSLKNQADIEIINIRLAPINKSVQDDFIKQFHKYTKHNPRLVYHGTKLANIKSILQYGFLIPNQPHPTNRKAPIITMANGNSYGTGIYSSETADFSISYGPNTNTLLVCAALPECNDAGHPTRSSGNILVLSHVSQIIPLFLMDFRFVNRSDVNHCWFNKNYTPKTVIPKDTDKPLIILRKYLRKVLNQMKNEVGIKRQRRGRRNNRHKVSPEDEYQVRVFEPWV